MIPSSDIRLYLYGLFTAALPLLVFYGVVTKDSLPLWIALGGAVFSQGGAAVALMHQRRTGQVDPKRVPRRKPNTGA